MCFSLQADLVAGAVVAPLGVLTLRAARAPRELLLASLPLLFAAHQLTESLVWAGADGHVPAWLAQLAATVYVAFALPALPTLVPVGVWLVASARDRARVAPFVVMGACVTAYLALRMLQNGVAWRAEPHALIYRIGLGDPELWTVLYVLSVMGACVWSGHRWVVVFGVVNLVGLSVVAIAYTAAFASLWCVYAALSSLCLLVHFVGRDDGPEGAAPGRTAASVAA